MTAATPKCPGCGAKFSIVKGTCNRCGLPAWQFYHIEDPVERGRAIARWRRKNVVTTAEEADAKGRQAKTVDVARAMVAGPVGRRRRKALKRSQDNNKPSKNKHARNGVKR